MKKTLALMLAATALLSLTACGGQSSDPNAPVKVKYSVVFAATGTQADGANRLGELISEKSDGRMTMEFYPSSQLGDKVATMEGLINGSVEMTECAATDLSSFNSMWSVFSLPYLWEDGEQAIATVMDPEVQEVLNADMEANGFKIIAWTNMGSRSVMNDKHAVNSPADMEGLKIRCMEDSVLADATARVQPPTDKGRRLKIYYITQTGIRPPHFVCFCNDARLFHFSYQRYLENQIRSTFGLEGTPIRLTIRQKTDKEG